MKFSAAAVLATVAGAHAWSNMTYTTEAVIVVVTEIVIEVVIEVVTEIATEVVTEFVTEFVTEAVTNYSLAATEITYGGAAYTVIEL
ncbi:hypothetical protein QBC46DRAFT_350674 [Diplogelasinospora grovesii]|uniref:Uncharacterized protein n=1 Tax=Diplogelasinospora grovesii TaxID=303347 RepID=A0AAN6NEG8_9PEZI|nr:hypothetical protein QBC46DRAFT_350674 [Diplogelasinospora grovesii]